MRENTLYSILKDYCKFKFYILMIFKLMFGVHVLSKKITWLHTNITSESFHFHLTFNLCTIKLKVCNKKNSYQPVKVNFIHLMDSLCLASPQSLAITIFCSYDFEVFTFQLVPRLYSHIFLCMLLHVSCYSVLLVLLQMTGFPAVVKLNGFPLCPHFFSYASHIRLSWELLEVGYGEAIAKFFLPIQ